MVLVEVFQDVVYQVVKAEQVLAKEVYHFDKRQWNVLPSRRVDCLEVTNVLVAWVRKHPIKLHLMPLLLLFL